MAILSLAISVVGSFWVSILSLGMSFISGNWVVQHVCGVFLSSEDDESIFDTANTGIAFKDVN